MRFNQIKIWLGYFDFIAILLQHVQNVFGCFTLRLDVIIFTCKIRIPTEFLFAVYKVETTQEQFT